MAVFFSTPARRHHLVDPGLRNVLEADNVCSLWPHSSLEHNGLCLKSFAGVGQVGGQGGWGGGLDSLNQLRIKSFWGLPLSGPSPWVFLVTFNLAALSTFDFTMIS